MFFFKDTCCQEVKKKNQKTRQTLQVSSQISKNEVMKYYFKQLRSRYHALKTFGFQENDTNQVQERLKNKQTPQILQLTAKNMIQMLAKNSGQVVKKILKSDYQDLVQEFKDTDRLYSDPDFLPTDQFLGKKFVRGTIKWKRISQIIPNAQFISGTICPQDILQGALGNCYFLSALAAIAQNDFRIKNIFPNLQVNKNGFYMAKLRHLGVLQQVVVDDYIPVNKNDEPFFAKPAGGKQIWVIILQKCWAKLFGSYEAVIGGYSNEVLHAFSGAPTFQYQIDFKNQNDSEVLFKKLMKANNQGAIMCCGTQSEEKIPDIESYGLVHSHAYTLVEIYEHPRKLVKLRNPWGKRQWNGRGSQKDLQFWSQYSLIQKQYLGLKFQDDGIFFMFWQDYIKYFKSIDICMVSDNANYLYQQSTYKNDIPQMCEFETEGGQIYVSFSQTNVREFHWKDSKKGYGKVTLVIAKQVQTQKGIDYEYVDSNSESRYADYSIKLRRLQKGKYVIYSSVDWARGTSDEGTFSLYTQAIINLSASKVNPTQFLQKTYLNHAKNNQPQIKIISQKPYNWKCKALLLQKCGIGYFVIHLDEKSAQKVKLDIKQSVFNQQNLQLLPPFKGNALSQITILPGKQFILLFRLISGGYIDKVQIPEPIIQFVA